MVSICIRGKSLIHPAGLSIATNLLHPRYGKWMPVLLAIAEAEKSSQQTHVGNGHINQYQQDKCTVLQILIFAHFGGKLQRRMNLCCLASHICYSCLFLTSYPCRHGTHYDAVNSCRSLPSHPSFRHCIIELFLQPPG